jgi:LmbE family N-acetylglucosaminyl deacetylase
LKNVLAVGAHPDDIEHGAGGLLLRAKANGVKTFMLVLTNGANNGHVEERRRETRAAAEKLGAELIWMGLPDGTLQADRPTIAVVETHIRDLGIGTIAVHAPEDSHQDHRAATQVVLSAGRQTSNVLFYRSPSTLRFDPTVFVNIEEFVERKVEALSCHDSQVRGSLMIEPDVLPGLARYDGMQARLGWAEGFMPLRLEMVP